MYIFQLYPNEYIKECQKIDKNTLNEKTFTTVRK